MKKILIIIVGLVVISVAAYFYLKVETPRIITSTPTSTPIVNNQTTNPVGATTTSSPITASSTARVGPFTIVLNCTVTAEGNVYVENSIDVYKGKSLVQTLPIRGNMQSCVPAYPQELPPQDNPNNALSFEIDTSYGLSVTTGQYWIYNSSTQQFYCPGGSNGCFLYEQQ